MLAKGKCIIVNNIGSFAEIPDDTVIKLPSAEIMNNKEEVHQIYKALHTLCENADLRGKISCNARKYAEDNLDIKTIARQYEEFILAAPNNLINEELLAALHKKVSELHMDEQDVVRLARTLAYIM